MIYLRVAFRGFLIVFLVAANTKQIALGHNVGAVLVGGLISFTWWGNARASAHTNVAGARWAYSAGAMLGTATALWVVR